MSQIKSRSSRILDMTNGDPIKIIITFAIPLFIENIFQQLYSMIDTMVVGHSLGDNAIAAIGSTTAIYGLIINLAIGMNSGFGIVITRHIGANNNQAVRQSVAGMTLLNSVTAIVLTVFPLVFLRPMMQFLNTPESVFEDAYIYIAIIFGGMTATVFYNMFACILRAMGDSRTPLYILIVSCIINILLDIILVAIFPLGVCGAAIATVFAQFVSALLCGIYVVRQYRNILPSRFDFRIPKPLLWDLVSSGSAMALMLCVVDIGSVIFQRANNIFGEAIITAHSASRKILVFAIAPISTIATANSTFIGQNLGAKKVNRIKTALKKVLLLEIVLSVCATVIIFIFSEQFIHLITGTTDKEILKNAVMSLHLHFALLPVLAVLLCLRTTMQTMGFKAAPIISSCIELSMKILAAQWLIPKLGFFGTCITEPITWFFMMVFLISAYVIQKKKIFVNSIE